MLKNPFSRLLIFLLYSALTLLQCDGNKPSIIDPSLHELFGDIDLTMTKSEVEQKLNISEVLGTEVFRGSVKSDSSFNLGVGFDEGFPFIQFPRVIGINANFSDYYIRSGRDTTLLYWLDHFEKQFNAKPEHMIRFDFENTYIEWNFYIWHLRNYAFMISLHSSDSGENEPSFTFHVDKYWGEPDDFMKTENSFIINEKGDTISCSKTK